MKQNDHDKKKNIDSLLESSEQEVQQIDLNDNKFKNSLIKIINENDDVLRRLANS